MRGSNTGWFEFDGQKSTALGVVLMDDHAFAIGGARGAREEVAGRDGFVWLSDGATRGFDVSRVCRAPKSRLREIAGWLKGSGGLRFSGEPDAMYDAHVIDEIDVRRVCLGEDPIYEFSVTFSCQPHARIYPEASPIVIAESGATLTNPGSAPSRPRVEIVASGDFSLTIGKQTMLFAGIQSGIIVDSELQDALTLDESLLANDKVSGDFFVIQPGMSAVQWLAEAGSVDRVTITPRWRYR